jgi:hypothetical protein
MGDGTSEFVHPDVVSVYEKYGEKCFEMSPEEIQKERQKAVAKAKKRLGSERLRLEERHQQFRNFQETQVVHHGWLEKQGKRLPFLWHMRYFAIYQDGLVMYFRNKAAFEDGSKSGKVKPAARWIQVSEKSFKEDFVLECKGEYFPSRKLRLPSGSGLLSSHDIELWVKVGNESLGHIES